MTQQSLPTLFRVIGLRLVKNMQGKKQTEDEGLLKFKYAVCQRWSAISWSLIKLGSLLKIF